MAIVSTQSLQAIYALRDYCINAVTGLDLGGGVWCGWCVVGV